MIQQVIENLRVVNNEVSNKLLSIYDKKQEVKPDNYYASTIFSDYDNYLKSAMLIGCKVASWQGGRKLVETPLIFIKGNVSPIFCSSKNQGISYGSTLIDYITKKPLIIYVVDKDADQYSFTVANYNKETNAYDISTTKKSCANVSELINFTYEKLGENIDKFVESPIKSKK